MWSEIKLMISNNKWTQSEKQLLEQSIGNNNLMKIDNLINTAKNSGINPINEINKKWDNIKHNTLTKTKKENLVEELENLCGVLILECGHQRETLLDTLSKIVNDLGLNKTIHIKI